MNTPTKGLGGPLRTIQINPNVSVPAGARSRPQMPPCCLLGERLLLAHPRNADVALKVPTSRSIAEAGAAPVKLTACAQARM